MILVLILLPLVARLQLADRHRAERMDRSASRVCRPGKRPGVGAEEEAKLLNPLVRRVVYDHLSDERRQRAGGGDGSCPIASSSSRTPISAPSDEAKVVLRERNFRFALLSRSDLHRADLAWADLRAAQMWKTLAKGKLKDAQLQGAFLKEAQLQGAQLNSAQLQGADLSGAQLQGAELNYANLHGADLQRGEASRRRSERRQSSRRRSEGGAASGRQS